MRRPLRGAGARTHRESRLNPGGTRLHKREDPGGQQAPAALALVTECPPFPAGGTEAIAQWLERNPDARMVVIDVFAKLRGRAPQGVSAYDADYVSVGYAKRLADHYGIAVVLVHHVRKAGSDDFLTEVSGTNGHRGRHARTEAGPRAGGRHPARHRPRRGGS